MSAYIEIVLLDNLLIDYLLLSTTSRFFLPAAKRWRMLSAAILGAAYAVVAPMKGFLWLLSPAVKIGVTLVLVWAAFGWKDARTYAKQLAVFWLLSLAMGGLVSGLGYLFGQVVAVRGVMAVSGPPLWALVLCIWGATKLYEHFFRTFGRKSARMRGHAELAFAFGGQDVQLDGFVDTGNAAYEPLSGLPVVVVSRGVLERKLSAHIDGGALERAGGERLIPYSGLGTDGALKGFIPPAGVSIQKGKRAAYVRAAVALTDRLEGFDALIPPALLISIGGEEE